MLSSIQLLPVNIVQLLMLFVSCLAVFSLRGGPRYGGVILAFTLQAIAVFVNFIEELHMVPVVVSPALSLASGPGLYLFVRVLVRTDSPLSRRDFAHFLPVIFALFFHTYINWVLAFGAVSQLVYLKFSLSLIMRYQHAVRERRSDTERLQLRWLMRLLFSLMCLIVIEVLRANLQPYLPYDFRNQWYLIDQVILLLLLSGFFVGIVRQPEIFDGLGEFEASEKSNEARNEESANENARNIFVEIDTRVKRDSLFLQPRLTLHDIAEITGLNSKDISWAINQGGNVSFADYINALRVAYVVEMAQSQPKRPLLDMALDAGFSSKSSFNAVFKKQTGMSPGRYLKSLES